MEKRNKYFVDKLHSGQLGNIPYRRKRSQKNDPKWMTEVKTLHRAKEKYI